MRHVIRNRLRRSVVVSLKSGQTFAGVLVDADREAFVLRNVQHYDADGPSVVDGEVVLLVADVDFVQLT